MAHPLTIHLLDYLKCDVRSDRSSCSSMSCFNSFGIIVRSTSLGWMCMYVPLTMALTTIKVNLLYVCKDQLLRLKNVLTAFLDKSYQ